MKSKRKVFTHYSLLTTIGLTLLCACKSSEKRPDKISYEVNDTLVSDSTSLNNVIVYEDIVFMDSIDISYGFGQGNDLISNWDPTNFDTISEADFLVLQKNYTHSVNRDSSHVLFTDSTFTIATAKSKLSYFHARKPAFGGYQYAEYHGFIESFKLYLVSTWYEGEILTGSMSMIDSSTNINYGVVSVSDGPTEIPMVSHDDKFLLVHTSNYHYSNITVLERVDNKKESGNFKELSSFSVKGIVQDIGWLEDNRISFKLYNQSYFDKSLPKTGYYRSKKPINELMY